MYDMAWIKCKRVAMVSLQLDELQWYFLKHAKL